MIYLGCLPAGIVHFLYYFPVFYFENRAIDVAITAPCDVGLQIAAYIILYNGSGIVIHYIQYPVLLIGRLKK